MNTRFFFSCRSLCYFSCLMDYLHLHNLWARSVPHCGNSTFGLFWLNVHQKIMLQGFFLDNKMSLFLCSLHHCISIQLHCFDYSLKLLSSYYFVQCMLCCKIAIIKCLIINANNILTNKKRGYETLQTD